MERLRDETKDPLLTIMVDSQLKQIQNKEAAKDKIRSEARRIQTMAALVNLMLTMVFETKNLILAIVMVAAWAGLHVFKNTGREAQGALDMLIMILVSLPTSNCHSWTSL